MDPVIRPPTGRGPRFRLLFVAEAVTLAHVARPIALAQALDSGRFEIRLAVDPRHRPLWGDLPFPVRPIRSIPTEQFLGALARGRPCYDAATLRGYVREDLEVIREAAPDAIIGDFRLSLSISARLAGVPYLAITNAYWSPYARQRYPVPELRPLTNLLPLPLAGPLFRAVRPLAFASHTIPLNRVRREFGLASLGTDLRRIYTDADRVLYADFPGYVETSELPPGHHFVGPLLWSPAVATPEWWADIPDDRPAVYVNLGSSGRADLLPIVLDALADRPLTILAASLDRGRLGSIPPNTRLAPYLPGRQAAARAQLVICNGGSPATQQALAAATPVIGVAGNLDQHLNMQSVQRLGAGLTLRSDRLSPPAIRAAVGRILEAPSFSAAARSISGKFNQCSVNVVDRLFDDGFRKQSPS
ncbi:glycosyltransferase [Tautonia plasticadhaerens]|uniref:PGL/p-HBAD biosynthesis glycosyltransferase n=1 Tax=Tautonia plasticadhaerens TaxID=2527974 RepID=A0A518H1Q4_9BACT|nr:nucleotide disphospho-sugar-binding domain-containing protein [Tautonia plasticadhaerens]QDV34767.1 PGL/p-HBAD biosynthesis glycosyltransferase [Tautonia plasticadhaerens]